MNAPTPCDEIETMFWRETDAAGASKAIGHAWVEFKKRPACLTIEVNRVPALRVCLRYRENGPYLAVEQAPGTGETMGSCIRTAEMVTHYDKILEAHNALGEHLHSARSFLISKEHDQATKMRGTLEQIAADDADGKWGRWAREALT